MTQKKRKGRDEQLRLLQVCTNDLVVLAEAAAELHVAAASTAAALAELVHNLMEAQEAKPRR